MKGRGKDDLGAPKMSEERSMHKISIGRAEELKNGERNMISFRV